MPLGSGYASGYGASKWAGEVLLREAHEHFNLPVNIYRSDMILPHSVYRGQINAPDMFIRILFSVIATGIAPASFYRTGASATQRAHYGGLPVDFTAASISAIGADRHRGFDSYDVVNPHADDGISLDRIIDWAQSKGHVIERIEDYSDWLKLFDTRLRALPADRQSHSSLLLMERFARPTTPGEADTSVGRFQKKVRVLRIGQDADIPHLSEVYIHKCLDDMVQLGLITAPA
jgi:fatty acid CoA ligase FadD9